MFHRWSSRPSGRGVVLERRLIGLLGAARHGRGTGADGDGEPARAARGADFADFTGRFEAVATVEVRARVTGFLDKITFKEGGEVRRDLLFEIDPRPYEALLKQAQVELDRAKARLERTDLEYRVPRPGRAQGDQPGGLRQARRRRTEAEGSVAAAKASLEVARLNLDNTKVRPRSTAASAAVTSIPATSSRPTRPR